MDSDSLFCILNYLDLKNILNCSLVNQQFNSISKNDLIWKQLFEIRFVPLNLKLFAQVIANYYVNYKSHHNLNKFLLKDDHFDNLKWGHLSLGSSYKHIITEVGLLSGLTVLQISNNYLEAMPDCICRLTNLAQLSIIGSHIKSIPKEIGQLQKLVCLNLFGNNLTTLPEEMGELLNLESLFLHYNYIGSIHKKFYKLTNLQHLVLSNNQLKYLSPRIRYLTNLRRLAIDHNKLRSFPDDINGLPGLVDFTYSHQFF
jgi:Leucine-rich repeat (LRR) protein